MLASQVNCTVSRSLLQERGYRNTGRDGQVRRCTGTGLWRVFSPAHDAALVAEAQRNPFVSARDLKAATGYPGPKKHAYFETKGSMSPGTTRCSEGASH